MGAALLGLAALASTYAVLKFDGSVLPRSGAHAWAGIALAAVCVGVFAAISSHPVRTALVLLAFTLLGAALWCATYAYVVLDDPHGRQPSHRERRLAYWSIAGATCSLAGFFGLWLHLRQ